MAAIEQSLLFLVPLLLKVMQKRTENSDALSIVQSMEKAVSGDPVQHSFFLSRQDDVKKLVVHWLNTGVPPTLSRGISPGVLRRRTGVASCMLLPTEALDDLQTAYTAAYTKHRAALLKEGASKGRAATSGHKLARLEIGARFVESTGTRIYRVLPGVELLPVIGPNSLISRIGSIGLIPAQPPSTGPGTLRSLEDTWLSNPRKGFETPRLIVRNSAGNNCVILAFANNGALQYTPVLRSTGLLSMTSKMSAPSFSLPAGTTRAGGSCVSAAIASADPCQPNICAMCYALSANYAYLTTVLQQSIRLRWLELTIDEDPSGEKLGELLALGISSFARNGRGTARAQQEIGIWTGTRISRYGKRRTITARQTTLSPKHVLLPAGQPLVSTTRVTSQQLIANKVPGGAMVPGSLTEPSLSPKTGPMLRAATRGTRFSFDCKRSAQPAIAGGGRQVPLAFSTSTDAVHALGPKPGDVAGFLRIHDAGDITIGSGRSAAYQRAWGHVARMLTAVWFWQPTRAWKAMAGPLRIAMRRFDHLANTSLRPSSIEVDNAAPTVPFMSAGSTVNRRLSTDPVRYTLVRGGSSPCFQCPVYSSVIENAKGQVVDAKSCQAAGCRVCWILPDLPVTYGAH